MEKQQHTIDKLLQDWRSAAVYLRTAELEAAPEEELQRLRRVEEKVAQAFLRYCGDDLEPIEDGARRIARWYAHAGQPDGPTHVLGELASAPGKGVPTSSAEVPLSEPPGLIAVSAWIRTLREQEPPLRESPEQDASQEAAANRRQRIKRVDGHMDYMNEHFPDGQLRPLAPEDQEAMILRDPGVDDPDI